MRIGAPTLVAVIAATDKEQLDIFVEHFITVFNRTSTYDKSVLASLEQRPIMHEIGTAPDIHEVTTFFRQAKNGKATGLPGTSAERYKSISRSRELAKIMACLLYTSPSPRDRG